MSTPNFYSKIGTVYVIETEDDLDFTIDDTTQNIFYDLEADKTLDVTSVDTWDNERSYSGKAFCEVELKKPHSDILQVRASVLVRGGYYTDANIDIDIKVYDQQYGEYTDIEDVTLEWVADTLQAYNDRKPTTRQVEAVKRAIDSEYEQLKNKLIDIVGLYTTAYNRVATFSNGEAIYERQGE